MEEHRAMPLGDRTRPSKSLWAILGLWLLLSVGGEVTTGPSRRVTQSFGQVGRGWGQGASQVWRREGPQGLQTDGIWALRDREVREPPRFGPSS